MLFLRAAFLELLLCTHVIGAAVLFRRLFPRESAWFCFLVPILALLATLNFIEHFIALSNLGWLLPITFGGLIWTLISPGYSWEGLRFPSILFVVLFTFTFGIKCIWPEISNVGEGVSNFVRILNYSLGGTLPPRDSFMSSYEYGGYYSFQHYGAAILERLFSVDVGIAYNVSFAFLLSWVCLMGAGVAHSITGKKWIALGIVVILLSASTGSVPFIILFGPTGPDYGLSTNLNANWDKPDQNPFSWICKMDAYHPGILLQPPLINLYWSEFHSTIGGNFVTIASVLASCEVFREARNNWAWICLVALPLVIMVTSAWFFIIVFVLCAGSLSLAWISGRRPENLKFVAIGAGASVVLLWPFVYSILSNSAPVELRWTEPDERTPLWMYVVQWWPLYVPWFALLFVWNRLDLKGRWLHFVLPVLLIAVEFITVDDRKLTTEKMWAGLYSAGLVAFLPMVFMQAKWAFRLLGAFFIINGAICLGAALNQFYPHPFTGANDYFQLRGNAWVLGSGQKKRLLQVMQQLHGATILPGRSYWNFSQAAAVVAFSHNLCYIAYTFNEHLYGHGYEVEYRNKLDNDFYDGKISDPLTFLRANNITAVLIWPEDNISDQLLQQYQKQLGPEFYYIDCKMDEPSNAGLFVRQSALPSDPKGSPGAEVMDQASP